MAKKEFKNKTIERKIYFYKVVCLVDGKEQNLKEVFDSYINLLDSNYENLEERGLAIPFFDKYHFLDVEAHKRDENIYYGKFYSLRSTDFPYLFNMRNGNRQEITSNDQDTLMEQTHFYCFTNKRLIVSEYNYYGAKIEKLSEYFHTVLFSLFPSRNYDISISPIVIPEYFKEIVNCTSISKMQFKVSHAGLKILSEENIIGFSDIAKNNFDETTDFFIDIEISGGRRGKKIPVKKEKWFTGKIVSAIKRGYEYDSNKKEDQEVAFRKARIKAYNPEKAKTIPYDLLDEKLVHTCHVEKVSPKSKYVNSDKMYENILAAYNTNREAALRYMESI